MDKKKLDELTADHEKWDEHVATAAHTRLLSDEDQAEMDENEGLQPISIRLTKSLIETLKGLARVEGVGYQPLIRQVLMKYAKNNEYKLDVLLSAQEAAERADKLFTEAIRLRREIPNLPTLSNERIFAEGDYSKFLGQAQGLFADTIDKGTDPVLIQHAKLRMSQIADLCQEELQTAHDKKYGKKKQTV